MAISWTTRAFIDNIEENIYKFPTGLLFDIIIPILIYSTGYNMQRQKFFENIANVLKFGLFGTIIIFFIYAGLTKLLFEYFDIDKYDPTTGETTPVSLSGVEILFFCSIFVSSDIIAAVTIV